MNTVKRVVPALYRGLFPVNFANSRLLKRYGLRKSRFYTPRIGFSTSRSTSQDEWISRYESSQTSSGFTKKTSIIRHRSFMRWFIFGTLTAGVGLFTWEIAVPDYRSLNDPTHYYTDWKIRLYTSLPWNAVSSLFGTLSSVEIPYSFRKPILGWYVRTYGCDMDEAVNTSLTDYPTFAAFFNRPLKPRGRPISRSLLVSPADGTVLHFGEIVDGKVEYVKGHDFDISEFMGEHSQPIKHKPGNSLFQVVMYLAPGDYHAFHSPASWRVTEKIHYPGSLLSVRPSVLRLVPKLFCMNERTVLNGHWHYGFFSMSAVAATNVGDIVIFDEPNKNRKIVHMETYDLVNESTRFKAGKKVGEFRMGSAIVLIFEAPSHIQFCVRAGDHLRYGQSLLVQAA